MTNRALALVLFCASVAWPFSAGAAENPKPLRTLTYDLQMTIGSVRSVERDAIGTAGSTHGDFVGGLESKGRITVDILAATADGGRGEDVDILAATADGGLVADVRENATNRSRPPVRVAITSAGALNYDPKQADNVTAEESTLLAWLARGFVGPDDRTAGAAFTIDISAGPVRGAEHYRVVSADGERLNLEYKAESKTSGLGGGDMTRAGSLAYDTKLAVPQTASYKDISHRQQLGSYDTTEIAVRLELTADTFKK